VVFPFDVPRIELDGSVLDALRLPALPHGDWTAFVIAVITVTLITSVQSLLTAVSVDRMHHGARTDFDRELIGQGAANIASGAIGGLPIAGVIVRSAANVNAGAKSRASSIMHGVWILLFTLPFAELVEQVPTAALAGLLIVIGVELLEPAHIETAMRSGDLIVYVVTVAAVVFLNLLQGVMIGLVLAIALTGWRVLRAKVEARPVAGGWRVDVGGACTFLALPRLTRVLASVPEGATVTVDIAVDYLDHAAYQAMTDWHRLHLARGGAIRFQGTIERGRLAHRPVEDLFEPENSAPQPSNAERRGQLTLVEAAPPATK
ncbi:Sulfate permease or related transporter, MFS superfamily, partial [Mycobacterium terramassiliense]